MSDKLSSSSAGPTSDQPEVLNTLTTRDEIRDELRGRFGEYYLVEEKPHEPEPEPTTSAITSEMRPESHSQPEKTIKAQTKATAKKRKETQPTEPTRRSPRTPKSTEKRKASLAEIEQDSPIAKKPEKAGAIAADKVAPSTSDPDTVTAASTLVAAVSEVEEVAKGKGKAGASLTHIETKADLDSNGEPVKPPMSSPGNPNNGELDHEKKQTRSRAKKQSTTNMASSEVQTTPTKGGKGKGRAKVKSKPTTTNAANDDSDVDFGGKAKKKTKGAGKGTALKGDWVGTSTNQGHSAERPPDAPNDYSWCCANPDCQSGQTWYPREDSDRVNSKDKVLGRKTISHFFGRNKAATNIVDSDVWHYFCRKDYQRTRYNAQKRGPKGIAEYQLGLLEEQFLRLKLWRPEALFTIQLTKEMKERSNIWQKQMRKHNNNIHLSKAEFANEKPKRVSRKKFDKVTGQPAPIPDTPEEAFPVDQADSFENNWCGTGRTYTDVYGLLAEFKRALAAGEIISLPPVEFLVNKSVEGETIHDASTNYQRWRAAVLKAGVDDVKPEDVSSNDDDDNTFEEAAEGSDEEDIEDEGEEDIGSPEADGPASKNIRDTTKHTIEKTIDNDHESDSPSHINAQHETPASNDPPVRKGIFAEFGVSDDMQIPSSDPVPAIEAAADDDTESDATDDEDDDDEEVEEPKTPPPKFRLYATGKGNGKPLSSTYGTKPGSGKRPRDDSDDGDADDEGSVAKKRNIFG